MGMLFQRVLTKFEVIAMTTRQRTVYWLPRALGLAYVGLTGLFALDVLGAGLGPADAFLTLFFHLIPAFLLTLALWIAWRHEWIGGLLFISLGISSCILFNAQRPQTSYLLIDSPLFLIGALFWLCAFYQRTPHNIDKTGLQAPGGRP
jgi:hypothetical protein